MGKTGITQWVQVKGAKGQLRLVPTKEGELKKPGPNQRFKAGINLKKVDQASEAHGGQRRGGQRRGGRGGRGGREKTPAEILVRSRLHRPKVSVIGAKQKSSR